MRRRSTQALGLAWLALLCALVGALGPSDNLRTTYSWPPAALPEGQPQRLWYAPLLLARHEPEALSVRIPCAPAPPLAGAGSPVTVFATTRDPTAHGGLTVVLSGDTLRIASDGQELERLELPARAAERCAYRLLVVDEEWHVQEGTTDISDAGSVERMPRVDGFFSELDLRAPGAPSARVRTVAHGARTSLVQKLAWIAAVLAALAALVLVSVPRRPAISFGAAGRAVGHSALQLRPLDAVVVLVLHVWWFVGPAFFDDGWVLARQRNYEASGGFSAYYTSFGTNFPLDFWLEWLQQWLARSTDALLVLRIPTLVCLVALWFLCRYVLRRVAASAGEDAFARWALASAFLAGALAWGMTLRPEPVVALLATGVFACVVRFLERGLPGPLAIAAVLLVLALSAHPTGIVALAPLLVAVPAFVRWVRFRPNVRPLATIAIAAIALLGTLVMVDSNFEQRRADATALRTYGDETAGWRDELSRYSQLSQAPYGSALRRGSVALLLLAVAAFLLRRRRETADALLDLPATALAFALLLFLATPTKWPWHFGALIGLGALAVAAETARLRADARLVRGHDLRPYLVVLATVAAVGWSWFPRLAWGDLDLRTMDWTLGLESRITLAKAAGVLPLLLLAALALLVRRRRRHEAPWLTATLAAPLVAVPLIAFTIGVLVADLSKTDSWTLGRQNLDALTGHLRCGLADEAVVADTSSMRGLPALSATGGERADVALAPAPVAGVERYVLGPVSASDAPAASTWYSAPEGAQAGVFVGGTPAPSDRLVLEWGRVEGQAIAPVGGGDVAVDHGPDGRFDLVPWRFVPAGSLPARPPGADALRLVLRSDPVPGGVVALTAPVSYENVVLAKLLEAEGTRTLALPNLVTYFPCAEQPQVAAGVAEPPLFVVGFDQTVWPVTAGTSPFDAVPRLYALTRLPLTDSPDPPRDVSVYLAEPRIPGAVAAPAEAGVAPS
jgi:hypothetical protein